MLSENAAPEAAAVLALAAGASVVDLSVTLSERLPCGWPGHMPFARKVWSWFEDVDLPIPEACCSLGPYHTAFVLLDEHCGTHLDGPTHFIPPSDSGLPWAGPLGDVPADRLDLSRLVCPAAVVDVRALAESRERGVSPKVTRRKLRNWEERHGPFRGGEAVLLWTGWTRHYQAAEGGRRFVFDPVVRRSGPGWPALDAPAAIFLAERGASVVGIDAPSMGPVENPTAVHLEGLGRGLLYVEMLTNLEALPPRGAVFVFLPLKIAGSSGGPGRAIALVQTPDSPPDTESAA